MKCVPALSFGAGGPVLRNPWADVQAEIEGEVWVDGARVVGPWSEQEGEGEGAQAWCARHGVWKLTVERPVDDARVLVLENCGSAPVRVGTVTFAGWGPESFRPRLEAGRFRELIHGSSFQHPGCGVKCVGRPGAQVEAVTPSSMFSVYQPEDGPALLLGIVPPLGPGFAEVVTVHARPHLEGEFGFQVEHRFQCTVEPGERIRTSALVALAGERGTDLMGEYGRHWRRLARPQRHAPVVGWNSWDYYSGAVRRADMDENLAAAEELFPGALRTLVIDEGWEAQWGTWEPNVKFPGGLEAYCRHVRGAGWTPGIWTAPLLVNTYNPLYLEHPEWFARRADGQPQTDTYSYGPMAYLDPTRADVLDHLEGLFRRLREIGFGYFKVDFAHCILKADRFQDARVARGDLIRRAFQVIRRAVGEEAYVLSCGSPYESVAGLVDGVRLSGDIHIYWGHVLTNAEALSVRWWMQGNLCNGDPDFLVVRGPDTAEPPYGRNQVVTPAGRDGRGWCAGREFVESEARTWAWLVHLSGGDVVLSDPLRRLGQAGRDMVRRVLQPRRPVAVPVDLFTTEQGLPRIWISRGREDTLVGLFNWADHRARLDFDPREWGLEGTPRDFWSDAPVESLPRTLPRRSSLALRFGRG